ncbi:MAG: 3'-5' exonuclease [Prevotella sp.]|nr:3'-5' exonuclease [Prevotella sp.]MBP3787072.1 3'-5' exonuclease [Prevotella sp.]MBQ2675321.1 3'-5' exonuclease [Prevotella sp.]MBQ3360596.1 3'-5' exonuclease [Prevotella sp.]MBQ6405985.1 3'-5' exonuclease [Prevotella sp.]
MKLNLQKPLVIFDLETTGLDLVKDRIIQLSYIKVYPNGKEERGDELINPEMQIPELITQLTGISNDDVKDKPSFKQLAKKIEDVFQGSDIAGFNSNHFDVPLLAEEFLRAGINFDFSKACLIDACTIFKKMERRNLASAYKFYCGRRMEDDFEAHRADQDTEATYRVLMGELDRYTEERQRELGEDPEGRVLPNDMQALAEFSKTNDNVDFAGRIVWAEVNGVRTEVFNFGKHKGLPVAQVLRMDPGYYSWILAGDFTYNTKQVLTRIRLREAIK